MTEEEFKETEVYKLLMNDIEIKFGTMVNTLTKTVFVNSYVSYLMRSITLLPFFIRLQVNRQIQKV